MLTDGMPPDLQQLLQNGLQWVESLGAWGGIIFIAIYIFATIAFVPASLLTLGGGAVFGWLAGAIYVFLGATLGATIAFLIGRYLVRGWVAQRLAQNKRFRSIDAAVGRAGFKIVLLTRLSPVFPFNLQNYAYGVTQVSLKDYVLASIGMLPGTLMYVYIGSLFGNLAALFSGLGARSKTPAEYVLYGFGFVATVVVTLYIARIARKALDETVS
jgi:uncharacterized membrane protein YdjX (TVP38/TMEM64 family)